MPPHEDDAIALALTTACPDCAQQPGQPCRVWETGEPMALPHASRFEAANFNRSIDTGLSPEGTKIAEETLPVTDDLIIGTGLLY